jgi:hypothetical protein
VGKAVAEYLKSDEGGRLILDVVKKSRKKKE